jgi:RraA family protein
MSNAGFRIFTKINRPNKELVEQFRGLPVANIADEMNRFFCMDARIKPLNDTPLLGTAFTVKARIGDNLMFHKAIDMAQPGDVIVVDVQGDIANSLTGEIMMRHVAKRGLAGVVIDGAVRDAEALRKMDLAIYAVGITPKGPYKDGPGEINVPVCCGGVVVNPGDILVGDADGIVVISPKDAPLSLEKAKKKLAQEQATFKAIAEGTWNRSAYTDEAFLKKGCEIIDDYYKG